MFNVGYGVSTPINDIACTIIAEAGSQSGISREPARLGDVKHSLTSVDRLRAAGFRPVSNLCDGLAATLRSCQ